MLMSDVPTTRPSLLLRMRDAKDHEAWHTFVELYAPLVYRFARKRGLQDADAADLTQDVLRSVAGAMKDGKYDPARGSFRGWLHMVTRNAVYRSLRGERRQPSGTGDTQQQARLEQIPAPSEQQDWDYEHQKRLFVWACEEVRDEFQAKTWTAFWQTAVDGKSVKDVEAKLGLSAGAIYVAKSRILTRIRERIGQIELDLSSETGKSP
jgi:RNA polymerase sigma factor (sigma-70 family)